MIDPDDYWVNNPLITPINKVVMYDSDIYDAVIGERERIIKLLEEHWLPIADTEACIALIKGEGENK